MRLEPGHGALIEYALKVADAIGIKYGMIHGEYMLDKNGPVLIEVNCRPIGGTQPAEYMDMIFGQHETDSMLDSMLDPEKFKRDAAKPYRPHRKAVLKFIMVPNEMDVEDHPVWVVAKRLRSVFSLSAEKVSTPKHYFKTRDVESSGGRIIIPPEIYRYFSYGRKGAELLRRCTLEAPTQGAAADVVATRESL